MSQPFRQFVILIHRLINRLLIRVIDMNGANEVIKIVTKKITLSWVEMENHVEVRNRFFIPYHLEEVKLTYYNDAGQNVGYLHFEGPVKIAAYKTRIVKMPAKMSNITALFTGVRLLISDKIKTRTVGTSRIRFFGVSFELPIDDIMVIEKHKIVTEELNEAEKARRLQEKAEREKLWSEKKAIRKARREERRKKFKARLEQEKIQRKSAAERQAFKNEARKRLERIRRVKQHRLSYLDGSHVAESTSSEKIKELPAEPATLHTNAARSEGLKKKEESAGPGPDRSGSDPSA